MDARQENKVSMFLKVRTFYDIHLPAYATSPALSPRVSVFNGQLDDILMKDAIATLNSTGARDQKDQYRLSLRQKTLVAAGGLMALGTATNNLLLRNRGDIVESFLRDQRDADELVISINILQLLSANAAGLVPYGIDAAFITDYNVSTGLYSAIIQSPEQQIAAKFAAGQEVDILIEKTDALLHNEIDPIMKATKLAQSMLYNEFLNVRLIDDNASGTGTPDIILTLTPNSFTVAITLSYIPGRSFKVKNKGAEAVNWGLSTEPASFTNTAHIVGANNFSTKLSSTLAPNGANLLFQNPTATPIDIEVTIIE